MGDTFTPHSTHWCRGGGRASIHSEAALRFEVVGVVSELRRVGGVVSREETGRAEVEKDAFGTMKLEWED